MYRAEIISNQSIQDDIVELLEQEIPDIQYTIIPDVQGRGASSRKLGDTVWPEMNFLLFAYIDEQYGNKIKSILKAIKQKFPAEGISLFMMKSEEI